MTIDIKDFEKDRVVYLSDEINTGSLLQLKKDFTKIIQSDKDIHFNNCREIAKLGDAFLKTYEKNITKPSIELNISSPGGAVYQALGMYDLIREIIADGTEVICKINGYAASAATIVMLACDKRYCTSNTSFMIHSLSSMAYGKLEDLKDNLDECNRLNKILYSIYTNRTKLSEDKLREIETCKKDWWINANEAKELELVTKIL